MSVLSREEIIGEWLEANKCDGKVLVTKDQEPEDVCAMGDNWELNCNYCHGFCKYCKESTGMSFHHADQCNNTCHDTVDCLNKEFCSLSIQ